MAVMAVVGWDALEYQHALVILLSLCRWRRINFNLFTTLLLYCVLSSTRDKEIMYFNLLLLLLCFGFFDELFTVIDF